MRQLTILCFLIPFLFTCDRAKETVAPDFVSGAIRYTERSQVLDANLTVRRAVIDGSYSSPKAFDLVMDQLPEVNPNYFSFRRPMNYPAVMPLEVPCGDDRCQLDLSFAPVFVDSVPRSIPKDAPLRVRIAEQPLGEAESLVFFFEPADRSKPKQIKLIGPTAMSSITLPSDALASMAVGEYELYLIKQKLVKDSTAALISSMQLEYITKSKRVILTE